MPEKETCVELISTTSLSTLSTVTGASSREANFTLRWTENSPCAHITAQLMVASSSLVWRMSASTAPAESRTAVTVRRASELGGTLPALSTSTARVAAVHQRRCVLCMMYISSAAFSAEPSLTTAPSCCWSSVSAASSLPHSAAVLGNATAAAAVAVRPGRHTDSPLASTMQPEAEGASVGDARRASRKFRSASACAARSARSSVMRMRAELTQASAAS
mmetsp:Transcript_56086/g.111320  ORF Transcript_56086/g.111320 Transcript_56086/m.111320 type:complete len:219 (-) Transcript_56086:198-854(-)